MIHDNPHRWIEHKYRLMNDIVPYHFVLPGSTCVNQVAQSEPLFDSMTLISDRNDDNGSVSPNQAPPIRNFYYY
jgi:hypothetical protein